MQRNILIIGSTGFIGKNIIESLLSADDKIVLLVKDLKKLNDRFQNHNSIHIIQAELKDITSIKNTIISHKIDIVIHLASNLIPSSSQESFDAELTNIILPTYSLLEYLSSKGIRLVFFSSGGTIYGNTQDDHIKEDHMLKPISYYGYSKLLIENYIQFLNRTKNLSFVILRPSNVYGKYQKIESNQGFIAVAIGKALNDQTLDIWGDGEVIRDYIDVKDLAFITKQVIHSSLENEVLNIGSGKGTSLNQIITYLEKSLNKKMKINYMNSRSVDVGKMVLNIDKLRSYFDYEPKSVQHGIENFIREIK